jgi:hypothetical protein
MDTTYPTATIDIDADDDEARVWRWKLTAALRRLHFPEPLAFAVANEKLDIHYIEDLVVRGCPPHLAVDIARP